ncbi:MAG: helix-turn-helix domain-containing protein [Acidobacteria bacterium]|nr:helix-turn-helix domain-containing protein [Acidobacteriota bacterium]
MATDLKKEREKKKISLAQVASDTRISLHYLESIEEGRYSDLPGGIYSRAFIKAYCESINLDPREILEHYDAQVPSSLPEKTQKTEFIPLQRSFFIPIPLLIWSIMLLISAIGIFFSRGWIAELFSPYFADKPVADVRYQTPTDSRPDSQPAPSKTPTASDSESPAATDISTGKTVPALESAKIVTDSSNLSVAEPVRSDTTVAAKLRMEIVAKYPCWISVDVDGRPSSRRLMEPGEERIFNAAERLFILIGNAGGVQMKINGKPTKPLGDPGEVIKMNIDLDNLQQFLDKSTG